MNTKSEEDKLVELKEMLIGYWILENRSWDDWYEYKERNEKEWIGRNGLAILMTEEMVDLMVDKSEDEVWRIFFNFIWSSSVSSSAVQCSLVRLCTLVSDRVGGDVWKGLRVVCWVVGWMDFGCKNGLSNETIDCVVNYLVKVIDECAEMDMVMLVILTGEEWWVKMKMNSERRDRLRTALTRHSQTHSDTLVGEMDRLDLWDAERYQVGWCARWCVDYLFEVGVEKIPRVKLSRDRFDVRCDDPFPCPVRSPFSVKSLNVYFYEVICVTNGEIELGWTTREDRFDDLYILNGNKKNSIMLKVDNQCTIDHNYHRHPIPNPPSACPLNVFGCLLDVDNRRFEFYINGRELDCPITDLVKITKIHPKRTTQILVGFDEFCIGFDGFNRCIYHDNKTFQLENIPRWKAGDIVGCLIDKTQSSFKFYLNGIPINFNPTQCPIYFSSQPYHSLLSLSQFQQVYFNFGQFPFSSHRPKYIEFCDFYSNKPEVNEIQTKTVVNFNNANLHKNLIAIDANINQRDVTIIGNASTSKRSAESTESIGTISSVHTIASVNIEEVNNTQIKRLSMQCRLCCSSSLRKLVRFVCCDTFPLCLDCLRDINECPKCKRDISVLQTNNEK